MHGLIFETSIWLLAGSTRLLVVNQAGYLAKSRGFETLTELMLINCALCSRLHSSEEFFSHTSNTAVDAYRDIASVRTSTSDTVLQAIKPQHIYWCEKLRIRQTYKYKLPKHQMRTYSESSSSYVKVIWFIAHFTNWGWLAHPRRGTHIKPSQISNFSICRGLQQKSITTFQ